MTRVDFYILQTHLERERMQFAGRLCEKAFGQRLGVMLLSSSTQAADELSNILWRFKPESFLPHVDAEQDDALTPIIVSSGVDSPMQSDLLINLSLNVPPMFSRFQRLAEIVIQTPDTLAATRRQYGFYKDRGYPVHTHKL